MNKRPVCGKIRKAVFFCAYKGGRENVKTKDERCLCINCKEDYETAGYIVKRVYKVKYKDHCDKCGRFGWTYMLINKREK